MEGIADLENTNAAESAAPSDPTPGGAIDVYTRNNDEALSLSDLIGTFTIQVVEAKKYA